MIEAKRQLSRPVGVGKLMYIGDDCSNFNQAALLVCNTGVAFAIAGTLLDNKTMRNTGGILALLGFLAI